MIPKVTLDKIEISGNLAGSGAVMALCDPTYINQAINLSKNIQVIDLSVDAKFQNLFIKNLAFHSN